MTIPSTPRKAGPYLGTDLQTEWPFTFRVFAEGDILVTTTDTDGVESVAVLDTDYTVALNADQDVSPGGTVTYPISGDELETGALLTITGDIDNDQTLDLPGGGNFSPRAIENALDRTTMQLQQISEVLARSLRFPVSDEELVIEFPTAALRANKAAVFDADGNLMVSEGDYVDHAASAAAAAASAAAAAVSAALALESSEHYYGALDADPATRLNGDPIEPGDEYYSSTLLRRRVYINGSWATPDLLAEGYAEDAAEWAVIAEDAAGDAQTFMTGVAYFTTKALMDADLAYDAPAFARVYIDGANNGLYYKLGASGAGSWVAYAGDALSALTLDLVALGNLVEAYTGYVEPAEVTYGITTPDDFTITAGFTYGNGIPTPAVGMVPTFHIRMSGAGTGEIQIYTPDGDGTYTVADVILVTVAVGVNAIDIETDPPYLPAGSLLHYKQTTGGYPRRIDNGAGGSVLNNVTLIEGDPVTGTLNQAYTNTIAIAYDFVAVPHVPIHDRLDDIETGATTQQKNVAAELGFDGTEATSAVYGDDTPNTSTMPANYTYGNSLPMPSSGYLESCSLRLSAAGTGRLIVYRPIPGSALYEVVNVFAVTGVVNLNTFTEVAGLFVTEGSLLQYSRIASGYPKYVAGGAGGKLVAGDGALHTVGTIHAATNYANTISMAYTLRAATSSHEARIAAAEASLVKLLATRPSTPLESTTFPGVALPAGWTATGAWTVSNALTAPAAGGWGVHALAAAWTSIGQRRIMVRCTPADTVAEFGICTNQSTGGSAIMIDGTAGLLKLYSYAGAGVAGVLVTSVALPAALVAGRHYLLDVAKNFGTLTIKITDTATLLSATITTDQIATYSQLHGRAGVMQISGAPVTFDAFDHLILHEREGVDLIIADSNGEGTALQRGQLSWCQQLANMRNDGRTVVAARAGDTTSNFVVDRMDTDIDFFTSINRAVLALGTNDTVHASWRTNIAAMIALVESKGGIPILTTYPPRPTDQAVKTLMNTDVMTGYFGNYKWIDIGGCVSDNQDRVTWTTAYNAGDNVHLSIAGQERAVLQAITDQPLLAV